MHPFYRRCCTGLRDLRPCPRESIDVSALIISKPWLERDTHKLPADGWFIETTPCIDGQLVFVVRMDEELIFECGVAVDDRRADDVWPVLERLYLDLTDRPPFNTADWAAPKRPESTPWLATVCFDYPKVPVVPWFLELQGAMAWGWVGGDPRH